MWNLYFGNETAAKLTVNHVLTVPGGCEQRLFTPAAVNRSITSSPTCARRPPGPTTAARARGATSATTASTSPPLAPACKTAGRCARRGRVRRQYAASHPARRPAACPLLCRHYRAGLNMIPLIEWYRRHPEEGAFLLEVAMGAMAGQLVNIGPATGCERRLFTPAAVNRPARHRPRHRL